MNSITKTDYAKAKDINMSDLLKSYSIYPKNKMYSCLFHQDKTPSSSIGNKNKLYCFSCQRTSSTICLAQTNTVPKNNLKLFH